MGIDHYTKLAGSPAEGLAVQIWAELHAKGWVQGVGPSWDQRVVAMVENGACLAFIAYSEREWMGDIYIGLGGVRPRSRGLGLYDRVWEALLERARSHFPWACAVSSGRHVDNSDSARMMERQGRRITHVVTTFGLR